MRRSPNRPQRKHHPTLIPLAQGAPGSYPRSLAAATGLVAARDLNQDTLARHRHVLGQDHPDTLRSATILAIDLRELGEVQAARDLNHDTLARRRLCREQGRAAPVNVPECIYLGF
jgi:tetratricopeptide repeat protein